MPATPSRFASLAELADRYGVCQVTIRRLIARGELPAYRVGPRAIRVDVDQADALLLRPIPTAGDAA